MASSSQFAYSIHQRRHELLSELVSNVLQVTVSRTGSEAAVMLLLCAGCRSAPTHRHAPDLLSCCLLHTQHTCVPAHHTLQPDDENYGLALDYCLQKAYYHSFPDNNPKDTEAFYAECVAVF